jgi:hypothetical protein
VTNELPPIVVHHEREGERRFSRWDGTLFRAIFLGPGQRLAAGLEGSAGGEVIFEAWLRLVAEAIGLGYILTDLVTPEGKLLRASKNLVELLFIELIPDKLPSVAPEARLGSLVKAWNLGEGLLGEPPWLNLCVAAAMASVGTLVDLEGRLLRILDAALAPRARSTFGGPFTVRTLDLREVDAAFLPGRMHFGAPALVCVHDRKRTALSAGVLVGARGAPSLVFRSPCLAEKAAEDKALPTVTLGQGGLHLGETRVPLPLFKRGHSSATSRAGLVVASALDSQRLWVVESP